MNIETIINFLEENNISNCENLGYLERLEKRVEKILGDQQYVDDCNYLINLIEVHLDLDYALLPFDVKGLQLALDENEVKHNRSLTSRGKRISKGYNLEGNEFNINVSNGFYDLEIIKINK